MSFEELNVRKFNYLFQLNFGAFLDESWSIVKSKPSNRDRTE